MGNSYFDVAQICMKGHVINYSIKMNPLPIMDYCSICGAKTMTCCLNCSKEIKGILHNIDIDTSLETGLSFYKDDIDYNAPSFCEYCGLPYPWTVARIAKLKEMVRASNDLKVDEKEVFNDSINDIIKETSKTNGAIKMINNFLSKIKQPSKRVIIDILTNIGCEYAKRFFGI